VRGLCIWGCGWIDAICFFKFEWIDELDVFFGSCLIQLNLKSITPFSRIQKLSMRKFFSKYANRIFKSSKERFFSSEVAIAAIFRFSQGHTLVFLIIVHVRLLIFGNIFALHALIGNLHAYLFCNFSKFVIRNSINSVNEWKIKLHRHIIL